MSEGKFFDVDPTNFYVTDGNLYLFSRGPDPDTLPDGSATETEPEDTGPGVARSPPPPTRNTCSGLSASGKPRPPPIIALVEEARTVSSSKHIVVGGTVLVLVVALVLVVGWSPTDGDSDLERDKDVEYALPDLLTASTPDDAAGLKGRAKTKAEAAADPDARVLEVHVFDRHDGPLPGVPVELYEDVVWGESKATARTDRAGMARFPGLRPDQVGVAQVANDTPPPNDIGFSRAWSGPTKVTEWITTIKSSRGMPFRVVCFDVETGQDMPNVPWGSGRLVENGKTILVGRSLAARPGDTLIAGYFVTPPAGYVSVDGSGAQLAIARSATSLLFHHPLRREMPMEVTVKREDGKRLVGAARAEMAFKFADPTPLRLEKVSEGRYRIHGAPHISGHEFGIDVHVGNVSGHWKGTMPGHRTERMHTELTLSASGARLLDSFEAAPLNGTVGMGNAGPTIHVPEPEHGAMTVTCRLADGTPARGVRVRGTGPAWETVGNNGRTHEGRYKVSAMTDASGRATFDAAAVGAWTVSFRGWLTVEGQAIVRRNERTEVALSEAKGGALAFTVVDEHGAPLTFARLTLYGKGDKAAWRPVPDQDGVQRVDDFTDVRGKRTIERLPAGSYEVAVRWHGRSLLMHVPVYEGKTTRRTLTLER